jgi:hypothetical protein
MDVAPLHLLPENRRGRRYSNLVRERVHDLRTTSHEEREALLGFRGVTFVRDRLFRIEVKVGDQVISDEVP